MKYNEGDTTGLPKELQKELKYGNKKHGVSLEILDVLGPAKLPLSINDILIEIYKSKKKIIKRSSIQSAIYSLKKTGEVRVNEFGEYMVVK